MLIQYVRAYLVPAFFPSHLATFFGPFSSRMGLGLNMQHAPQYRR